MKPSDNLLSGERKGEGKKNRTVEQSPFGSFGFSCTPKTLKTPGKVKEVREREEIVESYYPAMSVRQST